jgi:ribosomal-protein-serine acetyltransferase
MIETIQVNNSIKLELIADKHAGPVFELIEKNRPYLREWFPWVDYMTTVDRFREFILSSKIKEQESSDYAYVIYYDNEAVGRIGIYYIDQQNRIGSIGYWLDADKQGQGIVTKSANALLALGFETLDLNRLEIKCSAKNIKSQSIPGKLKFSQEAVLKQAEYINDIYNDLVLFALTRGEWENNQINPS